MRTVDAVLFDKTDYPGSPGSIFPSSVAVDGGFVYWNDSSTNQILRGAADGSGSTNGKGVTAAAKSTSTSP